jgi:adenylate cyclase
VAVEIERKWVAPAVPTERLVGRGAALRQGYLARDGDVTLRLRIVDDGPGASAVLTVKAGAGLARTEVDAGVDVADAEQLWPLTAGRRIVKHRYTVPLDAGAVAEVDVYAGDLDGLCTVEVEFSSTAAAAAFTAPDWFGREVTGDDRWSNASLAEHGRPPA